MKFRITTYIGVISFLVGVIMLIFKQNYYLILTLIFISIGLIVPDFLNWSRDQRDYEDNDFYVRDEESKE
ncbi:MAG: hypothetical protein ABIG37_00985 [Nanoarchaeota archaeon]|nr:hypothetical protein [Nanoarchaeota archaeon]